VAEGRSSMHSAFGFQPSLTFRSVPERPNAPLHFPLQREGAIAAEICLSMHSPTGFMSGECMDK
jgi:hypothetical protein